MVKACPQNPKLAMICLHWTQNADLSNMLTLSRSQFQMQKSSMLTWVFKIKGQAIFKDRKVMLLCLFSAKTTKQQTAITTANYHPPRAVFVVIEDSALQSILSKLEKSTAMDLIKMKWTKTQWYHVMTLVFKVTPIVPHLQKKIFHFPQIQQKKLKKVAQKVNKYLLCQQWEVKLKVRHLYIYLNLQTRATNCLLTCAFVDPIQKHHHLTLFSWLITRVCPTEVKKPCITFPQGTQGTLQGELLETKQLQSLWNFSLKLVIASLPFLLMKWHIKPVRGS